MAKIENYIYIYFTQYYRRLNIPIIIIFPRAIHNWAHNNGYGLLPWKGWTPV